VNLLPDTPDAPGSPGPGDLVAAAWQALARVVDPEIGLDIVALGLVYGVDVVDGRVHVRMTMTSAACPMGDMIVDDAQAALARALPPGVGADIDLVWDPPWSPARMSAAARERLGWDAA
jgi:metal-sulfur cluster biosynthetic enzyme